MFLTLGTITALGGGIVRDVLLGVLPPQGLADWRFLAVALAASGVVFLAHRRLAKFLRAVTILGATATWGAWALGWRSPLTYLVAALLCFGIRMVGVKYKLHAPRVRP